MVEALAIARSELILGGQKSGKSRRAELLARSWLAQIALAASCVTSTPATITSVRRPSSDAGNQRCNSW